MLVGLPYSLPSPSDTSFSYLYFFVNLVSGLPGGLNRLVTGGPAPTNSHQPILSP